MNVTLATARTIRSDQYLAAEWSDDSDRNYRNLRVVPDSHSDMSRSYVSRPAASSSMRIRASVRPDHPSTREKRALLAVPDPYISASHRHIPEARAQYRRVRRYETYPTKRNQQRAVGVADTLMVKVLSAGLFFALCGVVFSLGLSVALKTGLIA